jgi:hypothetical protein
MTGVENLTIGSEEKEFSRETCPEYGGEWMANMTTTKRLALKTCKRYHGRPIKNTKHENIS